MILQECGTEDIQCKRAKRGNFEFSQSPNCCKFRVLGIQSSWNYDSIYTVQKSNREIIKMATSDEYDSLMEEEEFVVSECQRMAVNVSECNDNSECQ
jgi:hypothetical protein